MNPLCSEIELKSKSVHPRPSLPHQLHLELTDTRVAVITFDNPRKSVNLFDEATLNELEIALKGVLKLRATGLIFLSSKPSVFIAGADLETLGEAKGETLRRLIQRGQKLFSDVASLGVPTVAAIHGACVGGGLELSLACDRRIASDDDSTRLGLPETLLGILPAWGGSTRLPRLIGLPKALDLILSGKLIAPKHALKLGLIDEVMPRERLKSRAIDLVAAPPAERKKHWLTNHAVGGAVMRFIGRRRLMEKTRGNYPAQEEALEVVTRSVSGNIEASLAREAEAVCRLAETPAAGNLMRLLFLQEKAKRFRFDESVDRSALVPISRTAVIGAGVMGSGIAQWLAAKDYSVVLQDIDPGRVSAGMSSVAGLFSEAVNKRIMSRHEALRKTDLIFPSATPVTLHRCDLVIEAAVENLEVKKRIFADLSLRASSNTILATNTSALPITDLCTAPGVTGPDRIVGLHFFNPVSRMKLVEIVTTRFTSPETVERVLDFVRGIGKLPVVVRDSPGFLVNRILMPYLIEAGRMVDRGIDPGKIDRAMLDFGMPMGPLRLLDEVGLDVASHVAGTMVGSFGERFSIPMVLDRLVSEGNLGKKTGRGFYVYGKGAGRSNFSGNEDNKNVSGPEIARTLAALMVDEAKRCLDEGIVRSGDEIDFAMILGTGFAPFRGGPLRYGSQRDHEPR